MSDAAKVLLEDKALVTDMQSLFRGPPSGRLLVPTLGSLIERLEALEQRVDKLTAKADLRTAQPWRIAWGVSPL